MFHRRVFATLGIAASAPFLTAQGLVPLAGQTGMLEETVSQAQVVFEGIVFRDGAPVEGAVVVSSSGGKAVTERNGRYRLEARVPVGARSVRITAVGTAGEVATTTIELLAEGQPAWVSPLELAQGTACQPSWLPTFGAVPGIDDTVEALAVFDDGSGPALYCAGSFDEAGGAGIYGIVKWDGSSWSPVGNGMSLNSQVWSLTVFDDGSGPALYAGGDFTTSSGAAKYVARLDGSSWSPLGAGVLGRVYALGVYDDGTGPALYAGGDFTTAGGVAADHIARWDGSSWSPLVAGVMGTVRALEVYDDGDGPALYAGGLFVKAGGITANRIAKWDGSAWSPLGAGLNATVRTLGVFDDGGGPALYAGGEFNQAGGDPASNVAKWDGSSWSALGAGIAGRVDALTVFDDGDGPALHAAGVFATAGGVAASCISRWDGSSWSPLGSGMSSGTVFLPYVGALAVFDDGSGPALFAGGDFATAGSAVRNVAKWQRSSWSSLGRGLTPGVLTLTVFDDGRGPALYAGGSFAQAGGASRIARWDGSGWEPLGSGVDGTVYALKVFDDGSGPALYAGGSFQHAGGLNAKLVAKWDGSSWSALGNLGSGSVHALTVFDDGSGPALHAGGTIGSGVRKWNGSTWKNLAGGLPINSSGDDVLALEVFDDGTGPALYAGGVFVFVGGNMLSKWNGSSWSSVGPGLSAGSYTFAHVAALAVFDDGSGPALFAAGQFGVAGGVLVGHIARWDGSSWSSLAGGGIHGSVSALTVFDNGCGALLIAGGSFVKAGSFVARDIASWDGSGWAPLGAGMGGLGGTSVGALAAFNDRTGLALYAGGGFQASSGDSNLAKWGSPDTIAPLITCPASIVVDDRPGTLGETLTFLVTAEDEQDPTPALECHPPSGSWFPRGTTLVVCTATDAAGNSTTCQFTVTVGAKPPEVLAPVDRRPR